MVNNPVVWFEIYVNEMDRARQFYESVLDVSLEELANPNDTEIEMLVFPGSMDPDSMEKYGATGALVKMAHVSAGGNSTLIYFSCEDCAVEASRVEAAGGSIQRPKMSIGEHGFIALAIDTEGNLFGLHSLQ